MWWQGYIFNITSKSMLISWFYSETFHIIINVENCLMFLWKLLYTIKKYHHKNIKQPFSALIIIEQQISISDWILKNHVTLKTGVMMLKIQLWHHRNKLICCFKLQKIFLIITVVPLWFWAEIWPEPVFVRFCEIHPNIFLSMQVKLLSRRNHLNLFCFFLSSDKRALGMIIHLPEMTELSKD